MSPPLLIPLLLVKCSFHDVDLTGLLGEAVLTSQGLGPQGKGS